MRGLISTTAIMVSIGFLIGNIISCGNYRKMDHGELKFSLFKTGSEPGGNCVYSDIVADDGGVSDSEPGGNAIIIYVTSEGQVQLLDDPLSETCQYSDQDYYVVIEAPSGSTLPGTLVEYYNLCDGGEEGGNVVYSEPDGSFHVALPAGEGDLILLLINSSALY